MEWHNDNRISIPSDSTMHIVCILFNYKWRTLYIFASDCRRDREQYWGGGGDHNRENVAFHPQQQVQQERCRRRHRRVRNLMQLFSFVRCKLIIIQVSWVGSTARTDDMERSAGSPLIKSAGLIGVARKKSRCCQSI